MSDPALGSDIEKAPRNSPLAMRGRYFLRWSSLIMWLPISRLPRAISEATLIQPRDSSSVTRQYSKQPRPRPPYCSGIRMPK